MLIPLRNFHLWLPWTVVIGVVALAGWHLGGLGVMALTTSLVAAIMLFGFWEPAILTVYLVFASVVICILIGVPIGVWASRSERVARVVMSICDTLQTFPSFIYLIPVIMLLKVGDLSNIVAILAYATVPSVRFTYLGLKKVPAVLKEAAEANGCTKWQKFWKVELPYALPEIMLGINQTIMMALALVVIASMIGVKGLGQPVLQAIANQYFTLGMFNGLAIVGVAIIFDRVSQAYGKRMQAHSEEVHGK